MLLKLGCGIDDWYSRKPNMPLNDVTRQILNLNLRRTHYSPMACHWQRSHCAGSLSHLSVPVHLPVLVHLTVGVLQLEDLRRQISKKAKKTLAHAGRDLSEMPFLKVPDCNEGLFI